MMTSICLSVHLFGTGLTGQQPITAGGREQALLDQLGQCVIY